MLGLRTSGHASAHRPQGQALQALWDPWSPAACRLGGGASSSTCSPGLAPPPGSPPGEKGSPRSGVPLPPEHPALGLRSAVPVPRPRPARGRWLRVGPAQAWSLRPRGARQAFSKGLPRSLKATRPEAAGPCHRGLGDWVFGGSPAAEAWRGRGTETGLRGRGTESRFPRGAATAAAARPLQPPERDSPGSPGQSTGPGGGRGRRGFPAPPRRVGPRPVTHRPVTPTPPRLRRQPRAQGHASWTAKGLRAPQEALAGGPSGLRARKRPTKRTLPPQPGWPPGQKEQESESLGTSTVTPWRFPAPPFAQRRGGGDSLQGGASRGLLL